MALFIKNFSGDWCHVCGYRDAATVVVRYPDNAEHDKLNTRFIRICTGCAESILTVGAGGDIEIETKLPKRRAKEKRVAQVRAVDRELTSTKRRTKPSI